MGKIARSWALTKSCFRILRRERYLAWFPVVSGLAAMIVMVPLVAGGVMLAMQYAETHRAAPEGGEVGVGWQIAGWAALLAVYFVSYFIATFFNVGLISCVLNRLEGKPASFGSGMRAAFSRTKQIAGWALLGATVGVILRMIEERLGFVGRWVTGFIGLAWSLVTFMIAPVIAFEGLGPVDAVKRSTALFKQTWGEQLAFKIGVSTVLALLWFGVFVLVLAVGIGVPVAAGMEGEAALAVWIVSLAVFLLAFSVALAIVSSCLRSIYDAVLYSYAVTGMLPEEFNHDLVPRRLGA